MPVLADCYRRIDRDKLYPPFLERLDRALQRCLDQNVMIVLSEGFRSIERSQAFWQVYRQGGPRAAPPGYSGHNFGIAVDAFRNLDFAPVVLHPSWAAPDLQPFYDACAAEGLLDGRSYKDGDHFECPGYVSGDQLAPLREILKTVPMDGNYLQAVWEYLDAHPPWPLNTVSQSNP